MCAGEFVVFLVDDDRSVLKSLSRLLMIKGYSVRAYDSGQEFLNNIAPDVPGCAILDFSLPDINGLDIQRELVAHNVNRPVIFLSGLAEVEIGVKAMKRGAVDFLTKPASTEELLAALAIAEEQQRITDDRRSVLSDIDNRMNLLTPRESEVLIGVVSGLLNKQIAERLGISIKTVKLHRGRMMQKMRVRTIAGLVRLVEGRKDRQIEAAAYSGSNLCAPINSFNDIRYWQWNI